jgi:hypothetical protein
MLNFILVSGFKASHRSELVVPSLFFEKYSQYHFWKIELDVLINGNVKGEVSLNFKMNTLPKNGYCNVSTDNGTSMNTTFYIVCMDWFDEEGMIRAYEFFGT